MLKDMIERLKKQTDAQAKVLRVPPPKPAEKKEKTEKGVT